MCNYVVCGTWKGRQVFYDVDRDSGYPYASSWFYKSTSNLNEAIKWLEECGPTATYAQMQDPKVCRIDYVPIDISEILNSRNKLSEYVSKLSDQERNLLKDML